MLCSATLCEEVGSGNEKYDTSSLQLYSWSKFNEATAEPPSCPDAWFVPSVNSCKCGENYYDTVSCNEDTKEVGVLDCYCMTYDSAHNVTVLGACFLNCVNVTKSHSDFIYHNVPIEILQVLTTVCAGTCIELVLCVVSALTAITQQCILTRLIVFIAVTIF